MQTYNKNKSSKFKIITLTTLMSLVFSIGFCTAFLSDADTSLSTFSVGDVNILLSESENLDLTIVPDKAIVKDPVVTVVANSVPSYVFVEINESNNIQNFLEYSIDDNWSPLEGYENIYYTTTEQQSVDQYLPVLKDNAVTAKEDVRKETLKNLKKSSYPILSFSAYAIQRSTIASPVEAWQILLTSN